MKSPKTLFLLLATLILLAGNLFFAKQYATVQRELRQTQAVLSAQKVNERVLAFTTLFIDKVLQSDKEVDFDTRLQLENSVRAIGDEEILAQWKKFTASRTDEEAQAEAKTLLSLLVKKVEM